MVGTRLDVTRWVWKTFALPAMLPDSGRGRECNCLFTTIFAVGRVAQAFDLAGITNTVGAPFLRVFCEGREGKCGRQWI